MYDLTYHGKCEFHHRGLFDSEISSQCLHCVEDVKKECNVVVLSHAHFQLLVAVKHKFGSVYVPPSVLQCTLQTLVKCELALRCCHLVWRVCFCKQKF